MKRCVILSLYRCIILFIYFISHVVEVPRVKNNNN